MANKMMQDVVRYAAKKMFSSLMLVSSGLGLYGLYKHQRRSMVSSIDASLERGTRPSLFTSVAGVDRSELEEDIRRKFIDVGKDTARFGVILGPSGTGKTFVTRKACCKEPTSGVLYFEVREPLNLATDLADAVGLHWKPGFWDAVFEKFLPTKYLTYYKMPKGEGSLSTGISLVLDVLEERAANFCLKNDHSPVLFLDGMDLLAWENKKAFIKLVNRCKFHANSGKLRIVLVSSEGNVIPLIDKTSAKTRAYENMMEVLDIDDDKASDYLMKCGMQKGLAKCVVEFIGGRYIYLTGAISFMEEAKRTDSEISEDKLYDVIKMNMIDVIVNPRLGRAKAAGKEKQLILKYLFDHGPFYVKELMIADDEWNDKISKAVDCLVYYNLLRYGGDGKLAWHSRLVEKAVIETSFLNTVTTIN